MNELNMEVVRNLQLLISSKKGMLDSIRERGGDIVGGLVDYPEAVREIASKQPKFFKVKEGWKLGQSTIIPDITIDLSDVTDGVNLFRNCCFQGEENKTTEFTIDISTLIDCSYLMYDSYTYIGPYKRGWVSLFLEGGENITNLDYAFSNINGDTGIHRYIDIHLDYTKVKPTSMICTFENSELVGESRELWYTVNTEDVEDFTGCYRNSICMNTVVVNISSAKSIDEMFKGCTKEGEIYFFSDPSNIESMVDAFDINIGSSMPTLKYDYRYDYSHIIDKIVSGGKMNIMPMTESELEYYLNIFPTW